MRRTLYYHVALNGWAFYTESCDVPPRCLPGSRYVVGTVQGFAGKSETQDTMRQCNIIVSINSRSESRADHMVHASLVSRGSGTCAPVVRIIRSSSIRHEETGVSPAILVNNDRVQTPHPSRSRPPSGSLKVGMHMSQCSGHEGVEDLEDQPPLPPRWTSRDLLP